MKQLDIVSIEYDGELITKGALVSRGRRWFWQSADRGTYELTESLGIWFVATDNKRYYLFMEAGWQTDFASVPWFLRLLFPQSQPGRNEAFAAHDRLYENNCLLCFDDDQDVKITRSTADKIMRDILRDKAAPVWTVESMYAGIVAGGWYVWNKYRKQQRENNNAPT